MRLQRLGAAGEATISLRERLRARGQRLSTVLRQLGERPDEQIRLREITETFGDRAFGALMFVFAVPNIVPLPPGASSVLGAPLILIAAQLALGRTTLWIPRRIAEKGIKASDYRRLVERGLPTLRRTERLLAPRLDFLFGPVGDRVIGVICLVLAIVLFLPIPFGNMPPALAIAAFALGLMQRDGAAVIVGWLAAVASFGIVGLVSGALLVAARASFEALRAMIGS